MVHSEDLGTHSKWFPLKLKLKGSHIRCLGLVSCSTDPGIVIKLLIRLGVSLNPSWINMPPKSSQEDEKVAIKRVYNLLRHTTKSDLTEGPRTKRAKRKNWKL